MLSLLTVTKAQKLIAEHIRTRRLLLELTQEGLAIRSGVSLPSLRKFEQRGVISLESFLKLLVVLNGLERIIEAITPDQTEYSSIDEVLQSKKSKIPKKGWRK